MWKGSLKTHGEVDSCEGRETNDNDPDMRVSSHGVPLTPTALVQGCWEGTPEGVSSKRCCAWGRHARAPHHSALSANEAPALALALPPSLVLPLLGRGRSNMCQCLARRARGLEIVAVAAPALPVVVATPTVTAETLASRRLGGTRDVRVVDAVLAELRPIARRTWVTLGSRCQDEDSARARRRERTKVSP